MPQCWFIYAIVIGNVAKTQKHRIKALRGAAEGSEEMNAYKLKVYGTFDFIFSWNPLSRMTFHKNYHLSRSLSQFFRRSVHVSDVVLLFNPKPCPPLG